MLGSTNPVALSALVDAPWTLVRSTSNQAGRIRLQYTVNGPSVRTEREVPSTEGMYIAQQFDEPRIRPYVMAFAARS